MLWLQTQGGSAVVLVFLLVSAECFWRCVWRRGAQVSLWRCCTTWTTSVSCRYGFMHSCCQGLQKMSSIKEGWENVLWPPQTKPFLLIASPLQKSSWLKYYCFLTGQDKVPDVWLTSMKIMCSIYFFPCQHVWDTSEKTSKSLRSWTKSKKVDAFGHLCPNPVCRT